MSDTLLARPRPRLIRRPPLVIPTAAQTNAFSGAARARNARFSHDTGANSAALTPESLAYSLPGGLAKLAYKNWIYAPWLKYIEDQILTIVGDEGKTITIMFSAPPRHGKTMFLSRVVPAWYLGRFPDHRVLLITYQQDFSRTQSRHARNIFKAYGDAVFGLQVSDDSSAANQWDIAGHEGGMEAVGAGGAITGKGTHLLILDDLVKGFEEASSLTLLEKRWEWFLTDVYSRLEPNASVLIIMTRWSSFDVIGQIQNVQATAALEDEENPFEGWVTINFPALAVENDLLGRKPGEALFPKRYTEKMLLNRKSVMDRVKGQFWFESLYQGNPVPFKGDIVDVDWFRNRYKDAPERKDFELIIISADTASKDTELADFTVFGIWGIHDSKYYLLDLIRAKMEYPEILETARALKYWRPDFFLIEDKGSGIALLQDMRKEGGMNVVPINPGAESKVLRMMAETPTIRAGLIILPEEAAWVNEYLMEMRSFPRGKKDQVDMTSQFLKFMRVNSSGIEMF